MATEKKKSSAKAAPAAKKALGFDFKKKANQVLKDRKTKKAC